MTGKAAVTGPASAGRRLWNSANGAASAGARYAGAQSQKSGVVEQDRKRV